VIASLGAVVILDEALRALQIAGGTLVLIAIGVIVRSTDAAAADVPR
jgi:drug/metabolite transporter (DMT)-like permease